MWLKLFFYIPTFRLGVRYMYVPAYMGTMAPENGDDTSIRIKLETWRRLKNRKNWPDQSFDDVITDLLDAVEESDEGNADRLATPSAPADD